MEGLRQGLAYQWLLLPASSPLPLLLLPLLTAEPSWEVRKTERRGTQPWGDMRQSGQEPGWGLEGGRMAVLSLQGWGAPGAQTPGPGKGGSWDSSPPHLALLTGFSH